MSEDNQLHQFYDGIWTLLEAHTEFTTLVPSKNRIKYMGDERDPLHQSALTDDYSQVRVVFLSFIPQMFRTSNSCCITVRFAIQVAAGTQLMEDFLDVVWAIYHAMSNWATTLQALTWKTVSFVKKCRPISAELTMDDYRANHGKKGWSTVWVAEADLWVSTDTIQLSGT